METLGNQKNEKNENLPNKIYCCGSCYFNTCKLTDFNRHLLTRKHLKNTVGNQKNEKNEKNENFEKSDQISLLNYYVCENCNKTYFNKSGLWKHKQKCQEFNSIVTDKDLMLMLINQNKELMEIVKNGTHKTINNNNINSNNKTFNLQVFLNETCKDAMNISDFIESVKLQVSDLENIGKVGYIEGISNIIIKNLNALEVEKRPVHCTDQKREVIYVKEDNIWEKEDENNKKLRKTIRMIAHKNICMFKEYREKYPDCEEYNSKKNDQFNKIIYESMGGKGDNDYEKDSKIIKKIAKAVGISKDY